MRNPFRTKNLRRRFLPAALLGAGLVLVSRPDAASVWMGLPWVVLGLLLRAWAVGHLVKTERFTVTGPYAFVRHPLYLGTACIGAGVALMLGGFVGLVALAILGVWFLGFYFPRKERLETVRLLERHGAAYRRYRAEVPALWPRLRRWSGGNEIEPEGARWRFGRYDANNELGTLIAVCLAVALVVVRGSLG